MTGPLISPPEGMVIASILEAMGIVESADNTNPAELPSRVIDTAIDAVVIHLKTYFNCVLSVSDSPSDWTFAKKLADRFVVPCILATDITSLSRSKRLLIANAFLADGKSVLDAKNAVAEANSDSKTRHSVVGGVTIYSRRRRADEKLREFAFPLFVIASRVELDQVRKINALARERALEEQRALEALARDWGLEEELGLNAKKT